MGDALKGFDAGGIALFAVGVLLVIGGVSLLRLVAPSVIDCIMGPQPFCGNYWNATNFDTIIVAIGLILIIVGEVKTARQAKKSSAESPSD